MDEDFDKRVAALVEHAEETTDANVRRITIDVQESGELPYRVEIEDDQYPQVGVAKIGDVR